MVMICDKCGREVMVRHRVRDADGMVRKFCPDCYNQMMSQLKDVYS